MEFGHVELFVRDMEAARRFYVDLLGGEVLVEQGNGRYLWVEFGERELLLRVGDPGKPADSYNDAGVGLVLYTDSLAADVERLLGAGVTCEAMPDEPSCFSLQDPDGHWWQLVEPMHP